MIAYVNEFPFPNLKQFEIWFYQQTSFKSSFIHIWKIQMLFVHMRIFSLSFFTWESTSVLIRAMQTLLIAGHKLKKNRELCVWIMNNKNLTIYTYIFIFLKSYYFNTNQKNTKIRYFRYYKQHYLKLYHKLRLNWYLNLEQSLAE